MWRESAEICMNTSYSLLRRLGYGNQGFDSHISDPHAAAAAAAAALKQMSTENEGCHCVSRREKIDMLVCKTRILSCSSA